MTKNESSGRRWHVRSHTDLKRDIYEMRGFISDLIHGFAPTEIYAKMPDVLLEFIYDQKMVSHEQCQTKLQTVKKEDFVEKDISYEEWRNKTERRMVLSKKSADKIDAMLVNRGELNSLFPMYRNKNKKKSKEEE